MKNSNTILLGVLVLILIIITAGAVFFGSTINKFSDEEWIGHNMVSKEVILEPFTTLTTHGNFTIDFTQDSICKLIINADSALMDKIKYSVKQGDLQFNVDRNGKYPKIKLTLSAPSLEKIDISAGSSFKTNKLKSNSFIANGSAGSQMEIVGDFNEFSTDISAGCSLNVKGTTNLFNIDGSAGVEIKAGEFVAKKCNVDLSAGAFADINVVDELGVDASAGAAITYSGSPRITKMDLSAGGSLKKK